MTVSKFPKLRFPQLWGPITLCVELWLTWGPKQSCTSYWEFSNDMSHTTWTQGNQSDFWLLLVGSQTVNLTLNPSFDHNLCLKCPNGSCEPILDIYILSSFQCHRELFNPIDLTPVIALWRFESSSRLQFRKLKLIWECGVHSFTLSHTPRSMKCDSWPSHWVQTFASPCLGRKPKVKVATILLIYFFLFWKI